MKHFAVGLLFSVSALPGAAQHCTLSALSSQFSLDVEHRRDLRRESQDTSWVRVIVTNKRTGNRQVIRFTANWLFANVFQNCRATRSYSTGVRKSAEVLDNDYGDVIVADFNFDGLDDFAIKRDSGGNAGPTYIFYVQQKNGAFIPDLFLTERMESFPEIRTKQRALVTHVYAGGMRGCRTSYHYNNERRSWRLGRRSYSGGE